MWISRGQLELDHGSFKICIISLNQVEWSLEVNWVVLSKWRLAISLSDQGQSSEIGGDFVAYDVP